MPVIQGAARSHMVDTICAVATPPGRGGIGIVRVSGPLTGKAITTVSRTLPQPRMATLTDFRDRDGDVIDNGIVLFFPKPHSYTGEDVAEFQGHGSPVAQQRLVEALHELGIRLAHPGEFTQRAFVNDKLDLAQAEAVADLIASASTEAAKAATRSLQGAFSRHVNKLDNAILRLRVYIEGALDFAEEEIDFLSEASQAKQLDSLLDKLDETIRRASAGQAMQQGLEVAIVGRPNVGKSSLLNALLGEDRAIVTPSAGTTRDLIEGEISLDGLPVRLVDTAGLHESKDPIETEGIRRARMALDRADVTLLVDEDASEDLESPITVGVNTLHVLNKCDLTNKPAGKIGPQRYRVSALKKKGLDELCEGLKEQAGFQTGTDAFAGRPRHLQLLNSVRTELATAKHELDRQEGELVAENLRLAHEFLGEIVGVTTPDDLLGEIFSTFCIGK